MIINFLLSSDKLFQSRIDEDKNLSNSTSLNDIEALRCFLRFVMCTENFLELVAEQDY